MDRLMSFLGLSVFLALLAGPVPAGNKPIELSQPDPSAFMSILAETLEKVYARAQVPVTFTRFPPKRSIAMVSSGQMDGNIGRIAAFGETRPNLIRIDPPLGYARTVAFIRRDSALQIEGLDDLKDLHVGIVNGVLHAERAAQHAKTVRVTKNLEQLFNMLAAQRIDVALYSEVAGELALVRGGFDTLMAVETTFGSHGQHHYLNARHGDVAQAISATIGEMAETGELEALNDAGISRLLEKARMEMPSQ